MRCLVLVLALFAQVARSDWDGTWLPHGEGRPFATYEEYVAYKQVLYDQAREIAKEHCGEPYFGTWCQ